MTEAIKPDNGHIHEPEWGCVIPPNEWEIYLKAIKAARATGAQFMLGGAFGLARYTGRCRNTKDIDFFVVPSSKDKVIDAITKAGFVDYYSEMPYDRGWIYRAVQDETIVDTIWQTPNRRSEVDEEWLKRARSMTLHGEKLLVIPAEELLCIKLYVIQRDRCDWPDLLNLLYAVGTDLDWKHVVARMGTELPLLQGLLHLFNWLAPQVARNLPGWLRAQMHLPEPSSEEFACQRERVELMDSRPWFAAFQPQDKPMQL